MNLNFPGLDALRLILKAYIEMGIMRKGDEIIVPANTFIAPVLDNTENSLIPVLVEPDLNTCNLDISLIEKHIAKKPRNYCCSSLWKNLLVFPVIRHSKPSQPYDN